MQVLGVCIGSRNLGLSWVRRQIASSLLQGRDLVNFDRPSSSHHGRPRAESAQLDAGGLKPNQRPSRRGSDDAWIGCIINCAIADVGPDSSGKPAPSWSVAVDRQQLIGAKATERAKSHASRRRLPYDSFPNTPALFRRYTQPRKQNCATSEASRKFNLEIVPLTNLT